jgi:hypothetical protein
MDFRHLLSKQIHFLINGICKKYRKGTYTQHQQLAGAPTKGFRITPYTISPEARECTTQLDRQRFFTILHRIDSTHSHIKYLRQLAFHGTEPKKT